MQSLFNEIDSHITNDEKPSAYLRALTENHMFNTLYPFTLISRLKGVEQSPVHHPEGNALNHTLLVIDNAAQRKGQSSDKRAFMWAALLHDIGKADTTRLRNGKITSYNHDKIGAALAESFLREFSGDGDFINRVKAMVRWHMQPLHVTKNPKYADIGKMKSEADVRDIALLGLCDRLGRNTDNEKAERENIRLFLEKCGVRP